MARPVETAFAYFPLDCTFFSNEKVKALRREHGAVGVLTYVYILCKVYENGYYYKIKDLNSFSYDVAESITNVQIAKVASQVRGSINYMADSGDLLSKSCLSQGVLTSKSIQEQYSDTVAKFKRKSQISEYNLITPVGHVQESGINSEETTINSEEMAVNSEITARKRKGKRNRDISLTRDTEIPALEEIVAYCKERKNNVNPQRFFDYYTANGWMIGNSPIRDWKAVVRRWETNGYDNGAANGTISNGRIPDLDSVFTVITENDE